MSRIKKTFKDTVFRMLFSSRENMLSLYNALNDSDYTDASALEITTLEDAVYMGMKNDCSFVFNHDLNIFEHQSTVNPNMPLRDLFYLSSILNRQIPREELYRKTRLRIPNPRFVVFYLGSDPMPGRAVYRLSDLFSRNTGEPEVELTVTVINIDPALGDKVLKACRLLKEFAEFVSITRSRLNEVKGKGPEARNQAVQDAVDECIEKGILADFLRKERAKVVSSILSDYDEQEVRRVLAEDAFEQGETQLGNLIAILLKEGKTAEAALVAEDKTARREYYCRYGLSTEDGSETLPAKDLDGLR